MLGRLVDCGILGDVSLRIYLLFLSEGFSGGSFVGEGHITVEE